MAFYDSNLEAPMLFPLAWYLTWTTYGTWLHGDPRGSHLGPIPMKPNPELEAAMRAQMTEEPVFLTDEQRKIVEKKIAEECAAQGWTLHALNARTNHVHAVVSASRDGKYLRSRLKALASASLSDAEGLFGTGKHGRRRWWTEKGNTVEVENEKALEEIVVYVRDMQ